MYVIGFYVGVVVLGDYFVMVYDDVVVGNVVGKVVVLFD